MMQNTFIFAVLLLVLAQPLLADEAAPAAIVEPYQPPSLSLYGHLPSLDKVALSPSGRQQAMLATIKDRRLLVVGDVGKEIAIQVDMGDIKARKLDWVGERYVVVITSSTQNMGMFYGLDSIPKCITS